MEGTNKKTNMDLEDCLLKLKQINDNYEERLNISGLKVYKTLEDGNCLFRALSLLYFGKEDFHHILR